MRMKTEFFLGMVLATVAMTAIGAPGEDFLKRQAYAEMQRVQNQMDALQSNYEGLDARLVKLEQRGGDAASFKDEVAALKAEIEALKRQLSQQREEIVNDLAKRIDRLPKASSPAPVAEPLGEHYEYSVKQGDTLSFIADTFGTSVKRLMQVNGLKNSNLRIGQKLKIPKEK